MARGWSWKILSVSMLAEGVRLHSHASRKADYAAKTRDWEKRGVRSNGMTVIAATRTVVVPVGELVG